MTQVVISPADQKVRERIRKKIHWLKFLIKYDSEALHALKLCRPTLKPHPERMTLLTRYAVSNRRDRTGMRNPQHEIHMRKHCATARLIVYGQLRGKEHTVKDPERWAARVAEVLEDVEKETA